MRALRWLVRMEDLEADIPGELERIYAGLRLDGFEGLMAHVRPQLERLYSHRQNKFSLPPSIQKRLEAACPRVFKRYGYPMRDADPDIGEYEDASTTPVSALGPGD